jgi:hypothetical protein
MIKLKTYKTFIKSQKKKLKVKKIKTQIETTKTNMINVYFLGKKREKKKIIDYKPPIICQHE